jgi:site-specific recombinase XerD
MRIKMPYKRLGALVRRLGLPDNGHYNHILRHTFATHAVMSGVPLLHVSAGSGTTSIKMTERYAHVIPSESQRHMERFDLSAPPSL